MRINNNSSPKYSLGKYCRDSTHHVAIKHNSAKPDKNSALASKGLAINNEKRKKSG